MPGYIGGSGSSSDSSVGGEIKFPKEFIDPVTKLRVSNPENLIDTDFEYGLQPTKWETIELINNTPSFFSKSGDTTIDGIRNITTNSGTREITIRTELEHGLAVGIPINVQGTKSITADGAYIINSIPDDFTFTYLSKDNQPETASIEDLYSSVITGEFFQGSQLRISSIVTDGATPNSELTVTTQATHGFGSNTPFYFLNLNSTIAQEFPASNTETRSFDSSNSATAQTFDGSNTLSSTVIDFSNSATSENKQSNITGTSIADETITVSHTASENFVGLPIGTPLYYAGAGATSGFFAANPRGIVYLLTNDLLSVSQSTFQVSEVPNGTPINITGFIDGYFQIADQARTFAGNNKDAETEVGLNVIKDPYIDFEAANDGALGGNGVGTVVQLDGGSNITVEVSPGAGLDYYQGAMVFYSTDGIAADGLTNNTTYFISSVFPAGTDRFAFTVRELPDSPSVITSINGGTGTQTFTRIGVSIDKDIVHIKNSFFSNKDMLQYQYPVDGNFQADSERNFYFVEQAYDQHNYKLSAVLESFIAARGGSVVETIQDANGRNYTVHRFLNAGTFSFIVDDTGTFNQSIKYTVQNGTFNGDTAQGELTSPATQVYTVTVASGGRVDVAYPQDGGTNDIAFATINPIPLQATGGSVSDVTIDGTEYRVHTFTSVGTSNFTVADTGNLGNSGVEYLIVAGGGGGGEGLGGGGGAGGLIHNVGGTPLPVTAQSYSVVVGNRGLGGNSSGNSRTNLRGTNGGNSSAFGLTALGGGGGAARRNDGSTIVDGLDGGSGGGGADRHSGLDRVGFGGDGLQPTSSSGGFGNDGGNSPGIGAPNYPAGGGGGAGQAGQTVTDANARGGKGGDGLQVNIDGNNYYWAAGGGGGSHTGSNGAGPGGRGGGGGGSDSSGGSGGAGGTDGFNNGESGFVGSDTRGGDAGANTGSGGGGSAWDTGRGGNGGTGIVIIRYPLTASQSGGGVV